MNIEWIFITDETTLSDFFWNTKVCDEQFKKFIDKLGFVVNRSDTIVEVADQMLLFYVNDNIPGYLIPNIVQQKNVPSPIIPDFNEVADVERAAVSAEQQAKMVLIIY